MNEIDVKAVLTKNDARMEALNGKTLKPVEWMQELAAQVYALNRVCVQQQEEIEMLKIRGARIN